MTSFIISNKPTLVVMFVCINLSLMFLYGNSTEFLVGDSIGWGVPKQSTFYNHWAEKKRFKINDTLEFEYKKDSVMEVNEAEYEKCKSAAPIFFENKGNTQVSLNRSGLFYFISGVTGHCERGQKMVVKVLDVETPPQQQSPPSDQGDDDDDHKKKKSGATQLKFMGVSTMVLIVVGLVIMG